MVQNYHYRARTADSRVVVGVVQATSIEDAKRILVKNQLTPLTVNLPKTLLDYLPFSKKIGLKERSILARQISTMIEAGLPLAQSLRLIVRQTKKGAMRSVLESILSDIQDGFSFSGALSKFPQYFDPVFINVVRSGEATGKLEIVLSQLADNLEGDVKIRGKIRGALFYPVFILLVMAGVMVLMLTKVIPQLRDVFDGAGQSLPPATIALLSLSDFMVNFWYIILIGLIGLIVGWKFFMRTETGQEFFSKVMIKLPVTNNILSLTTMASFGRLLGILLNSGVPLLESLRLINDSFTNRIYRHGLTIVASQVERGIPMSVPISENPIFPIMVAQMVAVGEQTGKMDEVMIKMADYYESEAESKLSGISTLIEPLVIVLLGVGVAWLVIGILMPIYQISTTI